MNGRNHGEAVKKQQQNDSTQVVTFNVNGNVEELKDDHSKDDRDTVNDKIPNESDAPIGLECYAGELLLKLFAVYSLVDNVNRRS